MSYLRYFLIALPVMLYFRFTEPESMGAFIFAALSILPLAGYMGKATEELAVHTGPKMGGFLNATFGNATELIIALFALKAGHIEVVKASLIGSIIGNILLVLGLSVLVGGLKHGTQKFDIETGKINSTILLLAVLSLIIPSVFMHVQPENASLEAIELSVGVAVVLFIIYVLALIFTFKKEQDPLGTEHPEVHEQAWTKTKALIVLLVSTVAVAFASEVLVGALEHTVQVIGLSEAFVGIILIPIIGNAAEHSSAVMMAMKNKIEIAIEIAVGSSIQIALMVTSVLVFAGLIFAQPMTLIFNEFELVAITAAVWIARSMSKDGETNWLEGVLLLGSYVIISLAFALTPGV